MAIRIKQENGKKDIIIMDYILEEKENNDINKMSKRQKIIYILAFLIMLFVYY